MIIRLTLKTPDMLDQARSQIWEDVISCPDYDEEEMQWTYEARSEDILPLLKKWIKLNEYVTIEIDTHSKTAKVLQVEQAPF